MHTHQPVARTTRLESAGRRPGAAMRTGWQALADASPRQHRLATLQQLANASIPAQRTAQYGVVQRHSANVVQRFVPLAMALGALTIGGGYGAYRFFRHWQRENMLRSIRREQANQNVEVSVRPGRDMDDPSIVSANNPKAPQSERTYKIEINSLNPVGRERSDSRELRIAEIHERTHVSADQAYSANASNSWLALYNEPANNDGAEVRETDSAIQSRLKRLKEIVDHDKALSADQQSEINARIKYAHMPVEYDPVVNELLAYTKEYGIRADAKTVQALVILARENRARRNPHSATLDAKLPAGLEQPA